jgi:hypothetical protein
MKMPNKIYDILKWVALTVLDAVGYFYQELADVWSLPFGDEVLKTCVAFSILLGALIGISSERYKKDNEEK